MKFTLKQNHKSELEKLANSGMTPVVIAQRAKILLMKADGKSAAAISCTSASYLYYIWRFSCAPSQCILLKPCLNKSFLL